MKRSEAALIMQNAIGYSKEECENILKVIEEAVGMLPPLRTATHKDNFWDKTICAEMDGISVKVALWETEDD